MAAYSSARILLLTSFLLAASPALAGSQESEAIGIFKQFCVLTAANPTGIDKAMQPVIQARAAGKIPSDKLKMSGIQAEQAWIMRAGASRQQILITTVPGICAVHLSQGQSVKIKEDFLQLVNSMKDASGGEMKLLEEKKQGNADFASYSIQVSKPPHEMVFALSTSEIASATGTKHLLTFSPSVKK